MGVEKLPYSCAGPRWLKILKALEAKDTDEKTPESADALIKAIEDGLRHRHRGRQCHRKALGQDQGAGRPSGQRPGPGAETAPAVTRGDLHALTPRPADRWFQAYATTSSTIRPVSRLDGVRPTRARSPVRDGLHHRRAQEAGAATGESNRRLARGDPRPTLRAGPCLTRGAGLAGPGRPGRLPRRRRRGPCPGAAGDQPGVAAHTNPIE